MYISFGQVMVWIILGALVGSFTGMLVTASRKGLGVFYNLGVGLVGVLIGSGLFRVLNLDFGLGDMAISFEDLLSAFVGALIFLGLIQGYKTYRNG